jgi:hypothetical protein
VCAAHTLYQAVPGMWFTCRGVLVATHRAQQGTASIEVVCMCVQFLTFQSMDMAMSDVNPYFHAQASVLAHVPALRRLYLSIGSFSLDSEEYNVASVIKGVVCMQPGHDRTQASSSLAWYRIGEAHKST